MKALERAYKYIYQLMTQPMITIQECDVLQLFNILDGYKNPEYIIVQLKEQVELQIFREYLVGKYGKSHSLFPKVFNDKIDTRKEIAL
ncbi:MAG: hypothetical protein J6P44_02345 [Bacteroidales bacterium]|nr:hypothetical protein [Bacteroidales bacterium]